MYHLPYLPRLVLTCALSSTAIILGYYIYKKRKTIISPDIGGTSITEIIEGHHHPNCNNNNNYNNKSELKNQEIQSMTTASCTSTSTEGEGASNEKLIEEKMNDTLVLVDQPKMLTRSLSGSETAPIEIINKKNARAIVHVSDEDLDYEIEKAKPYIKYTSPSKISADLAKQGKADSTAIDTTSVVKETFDNIVILPSSNSSCQLDDNNKEQEVENKTDTETEQTQQQQEQAKPKDEQQSFSNNSSPNKKRKKSKNKMKSKQHHDGANVKTDNNDISTIEATEKSIEKENINKQFNTTEKINETDSNRKQDSAIHSPSDQMIASNHNSNDDEHHQNNNNNNKSPVDNDAHSEDNLSNEFDLKLVINSNNPSKSPSNIHNDVSSSPAKQQEQAQLDESTASSNISQYFNMFDNHSDDSNDSGKGGSNPATPPVSITPQINEEDEVDEGEDEEDDLNITIYDFLIREDRVGEMIGRHGHFVRSIRSQTGVHVCVRDNVDENSNMKICTLTGITTNIDKALKMIRERFPLKKYPDIVLDQISVPPPIQTIPLRADGLYVSVRTAAREDLELKKQLCFQLTLVEGIYNDTLLSCLVGPDHLFMQQPLHPSYPSLHCLCELMNMTYSTGDLHYPPQLPLPIPDNTICAAYAMGQWNRVIILSTDETHTAYVKFLDYGGYAFIEYAYLRQMREDFLHLPFQAAECFLFNIKSKNANGKWAQEAYDLIADLVKGKTFSTIIIDYSPTGIPYVTCYVQCESKEICLNEILVERGFADWIKPDDEQRLQSASEEEQLKDESATSSAAVV